MSRQILPGHRSPAIASSIAAGRLPPARRISFALLLRLRNEEALAAGGPLSQGQFLSRHAPDPRALQEVIRFLHGAGLRVTGVSDDRRLVSVTGRVDAIEQAFHITLWEHTRGQQRFYAHPEEPSLPTTLADSVHAIVGLESAGRLRRSHRHPTSADIPANSGMGFFPDDLRKAYNVPRGLDGSGQTLAILEFGSGYNPTDLQSFWSQFGIPAPDVRFVSVQGAVNDDGQYQGDMEATLDIQWAGAFAPGANLRIYEAAPGGTYRSFALSLLQSLEQVTNDSPRPDVVAISYGDGEISFPAQVVDAWESVATQGSALGITFVAASGDQGAYGLHNPDGPSDRHADAPASLPHMLAVGGTRLVLDARGRIAEETGWTGSGGGFSRLFPVPSWQVGQGEVATLDPRSARGVPDVALNADPDTGYAVVFQGAPSIVGGTSVAAPIWAAFLALANQARRQKGLPPLGLVTPALYGLPAKVLHDILVGNNSYEGVEGYSCGVGWDAVTGLGSVDVTALIAALGT